MTTNMTVYAFSWRRYRTAKEETVMTTTIENVLGGIGNTPIVELQKVVPHGSGRVVAKLEWANPTGSMKDRMAKAAIESAEAQGRLQPGGTVVEYTAGTTGISLALVCAAKGYGLEIVFSDAFSDESGGPCKRLGRASQTCAAITSRSTRRSSKR
jgi:cysteine synthase